VRPKHEKKKPVANDPATINPPSPWKHPKTGVYWLQTRAGRLASGEGEAHGLPQIDDSARGCRAQQRLDAISIGLKSGE
jgi:hypothetical protein